MLRRLLLAVVSAGLALSNAGCFIPIYSNQPLERMNELLNTSEDMRNIRAELGAHLVRRPAVAPDVRPHPRRDSVSAKTACGFAQQGARPQAAAGQRRRLGAGSCGGRTFTSLPLLS